jgi:hypothetical protein
MTRYLEIALILLAIYSLTMYSLREGFSLQEAGSVKETLFLADWYPIHKPDATLSDEAMDTQYVNYPIFPAHSTNTNNLKQWRKPNNGQCVRPEICGNVYGDRKIILPKQPISPGFDNGIRVNYYNVD